MFQVLADFCLSGEHPWMDVNTRSVEHTCNQQIAANANAMISEGGCIANFDAIWLHESNPRIVDLVT